MTENPPAHCPRCGAPLVPGQSGGGVCPRCAADFLQGTQTGATAQPGGRSFTPPAPGDLAAKFPQLEILELIGKGGMGAVYKARQKQLDRIVALKILPPGTGDDPAFAERFAREARALAKLSHPNIVTIHDFGHTGIELGKADGGLYYLVMEYVDGITLRRLLETRRVSPREALAIVPEICDALQFAHDHGIVHRDIKPENVLLDRRGRVKVADFGLAKLIGGNADIIRAAVSTVEGGGESAAFTEAGKVMGTPQYMAPEQRENPGEVDHRADIYSLGVVFYQMLTGELPGKPIEVPSKKVRIDVRLDEIVLRALEKEPEQRYQQASIFKTQVETIASAPPPAAAAAVAAKEPPPQNSTGDEKPAYRGARRLKSWLWSCVPPVAVFLAFFDPWGDRAWYYFAAGCAILALLPPFFPGRRRARGFEEWQSPLFGYVALGLLLAGLLGTASLLAFGLNTPGLLDKIMFFAVLTLLPALIFGFASRTLTGRWSAMACITLFISAGIIWKEYDLFFNTVARDSDPGGHRPPAIHTPVPAPVDPAVKKLQDQLDKANAQLADWGNLNIRMDDPKIVVLNNDRQALQLQIKEIKDHPSESPELVAAKADFWRLRNTNGAEAKVAAQLRQIKALEELAGTMPPIPTAKYIYGPVTDRTIKAQDKGGYNFETGEFIKSPSAKLDRPSYETNDEDQMDEADWRKSAGVDLSGDDLSNVPPLLDLQASAVRKVDKSAWDEDPATLLVDYIFKELSTSTATLSWDEDLPKYKTLDLLLDENRQLLSVGNDWTPISAGRWDESATYFFRTLSGKIGLLQVVSVSRNSESVDVRWKFVRDATAGPTPAPAPVEQYLAAHDWPQLAAAKQLPHGVRVTIDGRSALKIENTTGKPLQLSLLKIEKPSITSMHYALTGEIKYENVDGAGYLEMWSTFPLHAEGNQEARFFSRTVGPAGSGPMGQIAGTSDWRPFSLPFDSTGAGFPPVKLEFNIFLPGRGVVYIGPLKLTQLAPAPATAASPAAQATPSALPAASAASLKITVTSDGSYHIGNDKFDSDGIKARLKEIAAADPGTRLSIEGEDETTRPQVIDLLHACAQSGLANLESDVQSQIGAEPGWPPGVEITINADGSWFIKGNGGRYMLDPINENEKLDFAALKTQLQKALKVRGRFTVFTIVAGKGVAVAASHQQIIDLVDLCAQIGAASISTPNPAIPAQPAPANSPATW